MLAVIAVVLALHYFSKINSVVLFWAAFIFTRPFGAAFGDFLVKDHARGGWELGTLETYGSLPGLLSLVVWIGHRFERPALHVATIERQQSDV